MKKLFMALLVILLFTGCTAKTEVVSETTTVSLSSSLIKIDDYTFWFCEKLDCVVIPDSVTYIGTEAFSNCLYLTSVTIPESVTEIGENAFIGTPYEANLN